MREEEYSYGSDQKVNEEFAQAVANLIIDREEYNPFVLYGADCEGRDQILDAIAFASRRGHSTDVFIWKTCDDFTKELISAISTGKTKTNEFRKKYREARLLILTQLEELSGRETSQQELYFILEKRVEKNRQTVFTSNGSPREIAGLEDRILAHLYGGVVLPLNGPGFVLEDNMENQ